MEKKVEEGFLSKEGPFVKALDIALQSFGVRRQNYHGGAFVGNHIHKTLEVHYIYIQALTIYM